MLNGRNKKRNRRLHSDTGNTVRRISQFGALLFVSAIFGLSTWGWLLMTDPATTPIESVKVSGAFRHVDAQAVSKVVAAQTQHEGFFTVDLHDVEAAVRILPWLYAASVRREWPNTLHVTVTEQQAVARWRDGGLVNPVGEVFKPEASSYPAGLPLFRGPGDSGAVLVKKYHEISKQLQGLALQIDELVLDDRRSLSLLLNQSLTVMIGRSDQQERLQRLVRFFPKVSMAAPAPIERIDLRYTNGFAVRFKPIASDASREANLTLLS